MLEVAELLLRLHERFQRTEMRLHRLHRKGQQSVVVHIADVRGWGDLPAGLSNDAASAGIEPTPCASPSSECIIASGTGAGAGLCTVSSVDRWAVAMLILSRCQNIPSLFLREAIQGPIDYAPEKQDWRRVEK